VTVEMVAPAWMHEQITAERYDSWSAEQCPDIEIVDGMVGYAGYPLIVGGVAAIREGGGKAAGRGSPDRGLRYPTGRSASGGRPPCRNEPKDIP
jgi:hypothetical protein